MNPAGVSTADQADRNAPCVEPVPDLLDAALLAWYDGTIRQLPAEQKRLYRQFHRCTRLLLGYDKPDEMPRGTR